MASSAGKVTGAHIWAFFFGIGFFVFLGMWYMQIRERQELIADKKEAETSASQANTALRNRIEEIESLLAKIGHDFDIDQVGVGELENKTKVLGAMQDDIETYGGDVAQETYSATIVKLRDELDTAQQKFEQTQNELEQQRQEYLALQDQYNTRVAEFESQTEDAKGDLQDYVANYDEMISNKDEEISKLRNQLAERQLELETVKEAYSQQLQAKENEVKKLVFLNQQLNDKIDKIEKVSYERPDGIITNVDNSTKLVWLNIGSQDNLTKQVTFSVYDKDNKGVGRSAEDIKAQIEVTRVWDNRAEARILEADLYRPITPGDEVYSPIWEKGREFNFSFVGFIDLDGDGTYDRDLLHDIVSSSGAAIDNEVGNDGEWIKREGISANTKFLVVGEIPDPTKTERPELKEQYEKIAEKRTELVEEARLQGTRVLSLNDFLAYIGFKSRKRLYNPGSGDGGQYTLKAGSRSTGVNESVGTNRSSTGRVSEIFKDGKKTKQGSSTGTTSELFKSGSY